MHDEQAIIIPPSVSLAGISARAEEFSKSTRLTRYREGLCDETIRRQKTDLATFARFLHSIGVQAGDFYHDLHAWHGIRAGLLDAFIQCSGWKCRSCPAGPRERVIFALAHRGMGTSRASCRLSKKRRSAAYSAYKV
jgi:hypothetical protein